MAITTYAKGLCNSAYLTAIQAATTVTLTVYTSGNVLLHTYTINKAACSVNASTKVLTLVEGSYNTSVANGIASYAKLNVDANQIDDNIPVSQGSSAVPGSLVVSSTTYVTGNASQIILATIG